MPQATRTLCYVALAASLFAIVIITLSPAGIAEVSQSTDPNCTGCKSNLLADVIANVLLFIPFGVGLCAVIRASAFNRILLTAFGGLFLSLAIEGLQYAQIVSGRVASYTDVLSNSFGALVGALIAANIGILLFPTRHEAARLATAWMLFVAVVAFVAHYATGSVMASSNTSPVKSQLPHTTGYGWFAGEVPLGTVNSVSFAHRGSGALIVEAPLTKVLTAELLVNGRDNRESFVPVLFVHETGNSTAHTMVGQRGNSYALRASVRADSWHMFYPDLVIANAAANATQTANALADLSHANGAHTKPTDTNTTRTVKAQVNGRHWELEVTGAGSATFYAGAWTAWMLLVPLSSVNSPVALAGTWLFLVSILAPLVYWIWRWLQRG